MRYVAAALLSTLGGSPISEAGIKNILDSVGIEYDAEKAKKVISKLAGKDLETLIAEGSSKLATGGGGGAAAPAAAAAGGAAAPAAAAKEEKKEEPEEESDDDI